MADLFLQAKQMMEGIDDLNYINYDTLSQNRQEFLRSDMWSFDWVTPCNAVYFPGNAFVQARTKSINPSFNNAIGEMSAIIRSFTIRQATYSQTTAGTFTIEYQDFEDQAISAWLDDWREKLGDRQYRYVFRKEDTCADGVLTVFNSSRLPIRKYLIRTIQIQDPGTTGIASPSFTSDDPTDLGQISATFSFEHYDLIWQNV